MTKKKRKRWHLALYTTGELNRIVDACLHPFFGKEKSFIILDGAVHALLEKDVPRSAGKFITYNLPQLLKSTGRKRTVRKTSASKRSKEVKHGAQTAE
jgi:hypothetical protein